MRCEHNEMIEPPAMAVIDRISPGCSRCFPDTPNGHDNFKPPSRTPAKRAPPSCLPGTAIEHEERQ